MMCVKVTLFMKNKISVISLYPIYIKNNLMHLNATRKDRNTK